jgi:hypothetical protein
MDYAVFVLEGNNSDPSSPSLLKWVEFVRRVKGATQFDFVAVEFVE